jgi:hypothetical protein
VRQCALKQTLRRETTVPFRMIRPEVQGRAESCRFRSIERSGTSHWFDADAVAFADDARTFITIDSDRASLAVWPARPFQCISTFSCDIARNAHARFKMAILCMQRELHRPPCFLYPSLLCTRRSRPHSENSTRMTAHSWQAVWHLGFCSTLFRLHFSLCRR